MVERIIKGMGHWEAYEPDTHPRQTIGAFSSSPTTIKYLTPDGKADIPFSLIEHCPHVRHARPALWVGLVFSDGLNIKAEILALFAPSPVKGQGASNACKKKYPGT
jgi:hypothetical protein